MFSSDHGGSRSSLGGPPGLGQGLGQGLAPAVVEALSDDDETGFRLRITWRPRPTSGGPAPTCSTSSSDLYA